ncbi:MAG: L-arabinose transport system permease protein AraQ [Anaerolineae bacterium]|nr:L-arabinose transport system permease protein AraQ [Anaerolineae bacterium]
MMKPDSQLFHRLLVLAGLSLLVIAFTFPLVWMFSYSLRSTELPPPNRLEFFAPPFAVENYQIALNRYLPLGRFLLNSVVVVVVAVPLTVMTASWAGFGMSQLSRRAQALLFGLCIAWLLVPAPTVWIPRFILFTQLGWIDTFAPLIAPALMGTSPFYVLLFYIAFSRISREVYDVARLEGAGPLRIWYSIALPSAAPSVITVVMLAFTFFWNDYVSPLLYMRTLFNYTLPVGIQLLQQSARSNFPVLMAASVIMVAPIVLLFGLLQRFFLQEQIDLVRTARTTRLNQP